MDNRRESDTFIHKYGSIIISVVTSLVIIGMAYGMLKASVASSADELRKNIEVTKKNTEEIAKLDGFVLAQKEAHKNLDGNVADIKTDVRELRNMVASMLKNHNK